MKCWRIKLSFNWWWNGHRTLLDYCLVGLNRTNYVYWVPVNVNLFLHPFWTHAPCTKNNSRKEAVVSKFQQYSPFRRYPPFSPPPFQRKVRLPVHEEWICIKCFFLCHLSNIHSLRNRWKQTNGYRLSEAFVATDRIKMGSSEACSGISTEKCCLVSLGVTSYGRV